MIEQLFGSKTRVKLLHMFYSNPNRSFYVREITRKIDEQINSVRRELANLLSIGIISSDTTENRLYYEVNTKYEYYEPLAAIFSGNKINSAADTVTDASMSAIKSIGNVQLAVLTGQFTRDERSGVDLLVVGDVNQTQLAKFVSQLEAQEGKEIRYTAIPVEQFEYRLQINDRFLALVMSSKVQVLVDKKHVFTSAKVNKEQDVKGE